MDLDKIEKLIELARRHGVHEIKVGDGEVSITINPPQAQMGMSPMYAQQMAPVMQHMPQSSQPSAPPPDTQAVKTQATQRSGKVIKSPFVGTFYRSASPGSDPFVSIGKRVSKGDTLCIVEAMKLMNEIEADFDGVIKEILVANEEPVEFDQALFVLE